MFSLLCCLGAVCVVFGGCFGSGLLLSSIVLLYYACFHIVLSLGTVRRLACYAVLGLCVWCLGAVLVAVYLSRLLCCFIMPVFILCCR